MLIICGLMGMLLCGSGSVYLVRDMPFKASIGNELPNNYCKIEFEIEFQF